MPARPAAGQELGTASSRSLARSPWWPRSLTAAPWRARRLFRNPAASTGAGSPAGSLVHSRGPGARWAGRRLICRCWEASHDRRIN